MFNPILILILLPIFDSWVYPALNKRGILTKPLSKMITGGVLAAVSFLVSGIVDSYLENSSEEAKPHILWLFPQYFLITVSEVMFSVTGLEFSFTQAPASMKSVVQAAWLSTVSAGNLIVVIIAQLKFFDKQSLEFFLFSGLMFIDMIVFMFLVKRYKYTNSENESLLKSQNVKTEYIDETGL